jgi:NAD(P)H-hydrate epimerase
MKVLTPAEMREVDRLTIEAGIPGLILMENAASRVVEFLVERFSPLNDQRIVVVCGKGNNGGDGLALARQLVTRFRPQSLDVFLVADPAELKGDAEANYRMYVAAGGTFASKLEVRMGAATLVIDALLGTGLKGPVEGVYGEWIHTMNTAFPLAKVVAVDVPSGSLKADYTVTFTAPKVSMVLSPGCDAVGEMVVGPIGSPAALLEASSLNLSEESDFAKLIAPRTRDSNKGLYGHVLIVGGGPGKTGAVAMSGLAALRIGAGLVTVASSDHAGFAHELMSAPLSRDLPLDRKTVVAIGPGLGTDEASVELARHAVRTIEVPMVIDADALTAIAGVAQPWPADAKARILTPHPGEMERLVPGSMKADRIETARGFAASHHCCVVLKGNRTVIAFPDGQVWINPTGSPAMSKAGSGDILTGLVAGLVAQFPKDWELAVRAAVYWHGRAGERAANVQGEKGVLATDLLNFLTDHGLARTSSLGPA